MENTSPAECEQRKDLFERLSQMATQFSGGSAALALALAFVVLWGISGPFMHYSDTWQLLINTGTGIVTFIMVFLIQRAQNKDSHVIHLKLNELVAALEGASNQLINVENLPEKDVEALHAYYDKLATLASKSESTRESHSIEDAEERHAWKRGLTEHRPATAQC